MAVFTACALISAGVFVGCSIGCIGIGGVVLVPILVSLFAIPVHQALPIAMAGYVLAGAVGTWRYTRLGTIDWTIARWIWLGAVPAAIAGSLAVAILPVFALNAMIAVVTIFCGVQALRRSVPSCAAKPVVFSPKVSGLLGGVTGLTSALTGTSGPVVLIPLLLWARVPALVAIGLAQTIQLPIATVATASYVAAGALSPLPGLLLGIGLAGGVYFGSHLASRLDQSALKRAMAVVLIGTGLLLSFGLFRNHASQSREETALLDEHQARSALFEATSLLSLNAGMRPRP